MIRDFRPELLFPIGHPLIRTQVTAGSGNRWPAAQAWNGLTIEDLRWELLEKGDFRRPGSLLHYGLTWVPYVSPLLRDVGCP